MKNHRARISHYISWLLFVFGCVLPAGLTCGAVNLAAFTVLRPVRILHNDSSIAAAMTTIEQDVIAFRGLTYTPPIERALLTKTELREKILRDFEESYSLEEAYDDAIVYAAFGLMDESADLYQMILNLYSDAIAGYYDIEEKKIFLISDAGLGANERVSYAHEYMHALQFQRFDIIGMGLSEETAVSDSERFAALQALIEGEASLVNDLWMERHFSPFDYVDYTKQNVALFLDTAYLLNYPSALIDPLVFPYNSGKSFVRHQFETGGWDAVDAVYANPPVSTEMILHPERYVSGDLPIFVATPVLPLSWVGTWREIDSGTMGEFGARLILEQNIPLLDAREGAAGWGGDAYTVWHNDETGETAAIWHSVWDSEWDALEFASTLWNSVRIRMSLERATQTADCLESPAFASCLFHSGQSVWWFYGPDTPSVNSLREANRH